MSRRTATCLVALVLLLLLAKGGRAEEEPAKPGDEAMKEALAPYAAMADFVGSERLSEAELKSVLAHIDSSRKVYDGKGRDSPRSRFDAHLAKTGRYDFSLVAKMREVQTWAKAKKLDARTWLRWTIRAQLLWTRAELAKGLDEFRKNVEKLEKDAADLRIEEIRQAAKEGRWILTLTEKTIAMIPAPTEEEKKALEKHAKAFQAALARFAGRGG